ncbi:TonB-dependent receptor plug [Fibrisoma limi BUZ 3]|uniref:TonB-dependent receptor plug n=1 Tax=Fibrisoma limi BUZ 3 TaxID=1185876 RepID=I2GHZ5_9BACT|nr:TonB-dependent receptor [Fibrisoma limi]CCH53520.1 TonB-dependent receptor plug [Fibrisoma limi BUZ 3]
MRQRIAGIILLCYFLSLSLFAQTSRIVTGHVLEKGTGFPLSGASVVVAQTGLGTRTDATGFFSIKVSRSDSITLAISHVGYMNTVVPLTDHSMAEPVTIVLSSGRTLSEVTVRPTTADTRLSENLSLSQMSISLDQLKKVPALLGEKDVLKIIQLLPGVQKGTEGGTGVYVRGGGPDQNLILLDDATIYNPNHLFGFFSAFNGDVLQSVELTKGGFPAQYGGRLSSVIDMKSKVGDMHRLHGGGSLGLIASRFMLEGPLLKRRVSFLIAGRRSYYGLLTQWLTQRDQADQLPNRTWFHDFNAKVDADLSPRDHLTFSGYTGYDMFRGQRTDASRTFLQSGLDWGNTTASLRWQHRFSNRMSSNSALIYSRYQLKVNTQEANVTSDSTTQLYQLKYQSGIRDLTFKYDWQLQLGSKHQIRTGLRSTYHQFTPSAIVETTLNAPVTSDSNEPIDVLESGLYAEHDWFLGQRLHLNSGLRLSHYLHKAVQFIRPEPRFSVDYRFLTGYSAKGSFTMMNQYVHMLSNTGTGLSTDLWVPTTDRVKPEQAWQIAAGMSKTFGRSATSSRNVTVSVEGYYKTMNHLISYREGSSFLLPGNATKSQKARWEDNVTAGRGWSSGLELLLQKKEGSFSGWIGYTLSLTRWQFPQLNSGRPFFPRYDRRHDVALVGIYEISNRVRLSGTWVYGTGQALTIPLARYTLHINNPERSLNSGQPLFGDSQPTKEYSGKNKFRAEPYHRLDVSLQIGSRKNDQRSTWEFTVYNAYNRRNPFFYSMEGKVDAQNKPSRTVLYRYSLFPVIPTINYSFKF